MISFYFKINLTSKSWSKPIPWRFG